MKKKTQNYIKYLLSFLYIFIGYCYIIYYISYHIRIVNKLEGWAYMIAIALLYFIGYSIINHLLIKRILSNKLLVIIEVLLFVSMFTLIISDFMYEEYRHLKYLQKAMPVTITP